MGVCVWEGEGSLCVLIPPPTISKYRYLMSYDPSMGKVRLRSCLPSLILLLVLVLVPVVLVVPVLGAGA